MDAAQHCKSEYYDVGVMLLAFHALAFAVMYFGIGYAVIRIE